MLHTKTQQCTTTASISCIWFGRQATQSQNHDNREMQHKDFEILTKGSATHFHCLLLCTVGESSKASFNIQLSILRSIRDWDSIDAILQASFNNPTYFKQDEKTEKRATLSMNALHLFNSNPNKSFIIFLPTLVWTFAKASFFLCFW